MKALKSSLLLVGLTACLVSISAFAQDNAIQVEQTAPPVEGALTIAATAPMNASAAINPYTSPTGGEAPNIVSPAMMPDSSTSVGGGSRSDRSNTQSSQQSQPMNVPDNTGGNTGGYPTSPQAMNPAPNQAAPQQQGYPTSPQAQQQQPPAQGANTPGNQGPVINPDGTQSIGGAPAQGMQIAPRPGP